MRVSAKRKKLFPVEESADGMGGPSGRVILSLSLPPSFSPLLLLCQPRVGSNTEQTTWPDTRAPYPR